MAQRVRGIAKVGRKTKELTSRLKPGDIAVIDHEDLDEVAALSLLGAKVVAVVNAQKTISGRYPSPGPGILLQAGILLVDCIGEEVFCRIQDGVDLEIEGNEIRQGNDGGTVLGTG